MTSLRNSIATLQRYSPGDTLNISDVFKFLFMERPVSLKDLTAKIAALPESVPFHITIVTDVAMGGEVTLTLHRNGSYRFNGSMKAGGVLSFSFRVSVVVRSSSGRVTLTAEHAGKVFGTDTPGDRQNNWDETVTDPVKTKSIRELWPDISNSKMAVSTSAHLSGVLGTATEIIKEAVEFFVVAETLGASLAICLVIGSELGDAGVDIPGLGGVVGIGIIAGALFIWGPLAIGPAFIIGVAAGAIIDALIKIRPLHDFEENFARKVFSSSLDFSRIRLTNLVGIGGKPFTCPTIDDHILINIGVSDAMFDSPTTSIFNKYTVPGQLLIHELTHAWQIQHATLSHGFVPGWLCEGIREQIVLGKAAYDYGKEGPPFNTFHIEAQASIVDQWFAGRRRQVPNPSPPIDVSPQMDPNSPYFRYIEDNIRNGFID